MGYGASKMELFPALVKAKNLPLSLRCQFFW